MNSGKQILSWFFVLLLFCWSMNAQQMSSPTGPATVPRLVNYSGKATDAQGKTISGIAGATFAIYKDQYEGSPLWLETQNIQADSKGNYTVQLGATKPDGLPLDLFSSGEARWLGVTINRGQEQPRVLLLSVPYALKAADAETIGGLPPSAFVLAAPPTSGATTVSANTTPSTASPSASPPATSNVTTTGGAVNALPLWTTSTNIQSSAVTQTGSGTSARVGVNTATPATTLDVNGAETVRGNLSLPATGTATSTGGRNSQPTTLTSSVFNSTTGTAVSQNFRWQAEPVSNNTSAATGSLNLLYGSGTNAISETGLKVASNGQITFAKGQTFPGTGPGTVTSVGLSAPASDFAITGSPVTKSGTLGLKWNVAPTNLNTPNSIVKRDGGGSFFAQSVSATQLTANNVTASNPAGVAIVASTSASNGAITGTNTGTNALADGVDGVTNSGFAAGVAGINQASSPTAIGIYGSSAGYGVYGTGLTSGVYGFADGPAFAGVHGEIFSPSSTGTQGVAGGVWGDTGGAANVGVLGTADDEPGGLFLNNSPSGTFALEAFSYDSGGGMLLAYNQSNGTFCDVDAGGNLNCSGQKHAIVPIDGGKRKVAMSSIESPQNWFEDFGSLELVNGVAVVHLDSDFIQTVNSEKDYNVFVTPYGNCKGLYVTNRTATSFEVHELGGGTSSLSFGYRITAIRRKYEAVRFEDHTNDRDPRKMLEQMRRTKPAASTSVKRTSQVVRGFQPLNE